MVKTAEHKQMTFSIYLATIAFFTSILIQSGDLGSIDTIKRLQVTHSFWADAPPVKVGDYPEFGIVGRNGEIHAWYGMGQSLVMLPSDIVATTLTEKINVSSSVRDQIGLAIVTYVTFPLISTLAVLISFQFLLVLGFTNSQSIAGSLSLLFGTTFLHYTQVNQENSLLFLMTLSGYLLNYHWLITNSKKSLFLGATALGFNLLIRLTAILDLFSVSLFIFFSLLIQSKATNWDSRRLVRRLRDYGLTCGCIYLLFIAIDRIYHWIRFGSFWGTYIHLYGEKLKAGNSELPESYPFSHPFMDGFLEPLVSPDKSIFLFDPLIIIAFVLLLKFWKRVPYAIRTISASIFFLLVLYLIFYARYEYWRGGSCWGPRFYTVPVQIFSLLSIPLLLKFSHLIKRKIEKNIYYLIIVFSVLVQISSIVFWYNLEESQLVYGQNQKLVILLRFINILAIVQNKFNNWGLSYPGYTDRATTLNFMPFLVSKYFPPQVNYLFQFLWFFGLIILIVFILALVTKIRRDGVRVQ